MSNTLHTVPTFQPDPLDPIGGTLHPQQPPALSWQGTLGGSAQPSIGAGPLRRTQLDRTSWIDHASQWLSSTDDLMEDLVDTVPWHAGRRPMYDQMVDVPRLSAQLELSDDRVPETIIDAARWLQDHYGMDFDHLFFNLYRDGRDSVAWHSDRIGRRVKHPVVALLSLGAARSLLLRPKAGGASLRVLLHPGDLLVMGGACQHNWEHAIPKTAKAGPRISIGFRHP